ncbi:hypothetical protein L6164_009339 [Bauhinia variegata]|uniref:Uncharacterized protein n=1 Tax=Bauhinia variegata TaxID=167791 RepID=A0ACB9PJE7_BAUVA|nr:hypothetical protein L6164_009339 [Bauhinia variegata]
MGSQPECQLPIVDFTHENMKPSSDHWLSARQVVQNALEDHGCFLALYDKVGPQLYNSNFSVILDLFDLPAETKKQKTSDKPQHGYSGQLSVVPLFESLTIDGPLTIQGCQKFTRIMWPEGNDYFCETVHAYAKVVADLDRAVKRMVFESYGLDMQKYYSFLESTNYVLRSYKYRVPQMDESNVGVYSHTDATFTTILHQKEKGLEIKLKNGEWIELDASPSLFLVLAGDGFKAWSNDRIRACEHRVTMNSKITRYSMGLLSYGAKIVEPEEGLVDEEHPMLYKPFDHYGYLRFFMTEAALKSECRIKAYCGA